MSVAIVCMTHDQGDVNVNSNNMASVNTTQKSLENIAGTATEEV